VPLYVPVIHCDESRLLMTLVLHVPDDIEFEDVAVRTVDSTVVVTAAAGGSSDAASCRLRVAVPLPKGCDSRSVVAALSSSNQLVLKARLSAACRRYTS